MHLELETFEVSTNDIHVVKYVCMFNVHVYILTQKQLCLCVHFKTKECRL